MSRRIEIELTSARPDGTWTWRAAGAREPKGVLDGSLLPEGAAAGLVLKADAEFGLDGTTILAVASGKPKAAKLNVLEILPSDRPFEEVTQQLAGRPRRDGDDRGPRRDRGDRPRSDRPGGDRARGDGAGGDRPRSDRPRTGGSDRPTGERNRGPGGPATGRPDRGPSDRGPRTGAGDRRGRPSFTAPPELPQRPKAKRLKPGRVHRNAVLADLPEAQRPVAERALQGGIPAVRQAVIEQNARLKAEGKDEIPAAGLLSMAEQLLPKLRVAEWLDRADAAERDLEELDLRDLRSVVAAAEDPMVARDESTRELAARLKEALLTKQDKELNLWFADIEAAIGVGRVVRALKLSSQPPKAGVRFPADLAGKLASAATASLSADAMPDRWVAVLEAAAFSPIRSHVQPTDKPAQVSDELLATVKRVGSLLPHIAALFGIEVTKGSQAPKPLRPTRPATAKKAAKTIPPPPAARTAEQVGSEPESASPVADLPAVEATTPQSDPGGDDPTVESAPVEETPVEDAPIIEMVADAPVEDAPIEEVRAEDAPMKDAPIEDSPFVEELRANADAIAGDAELA